MPGNFFMIALHNAMIMRLTSSTAFPMEFCVTRWIGSIAVAKRAILIWPNIVKMISFWKKQPGPKQPECQCYENVKVAFSVNLTVVKLEFFAYFPSILEPFLKSY